MKKLKFFVKTFTPNNQILIFGKQLGIFDTEQSQLTVRYTPDIPGVNGKKIIKNYEFRRQRKKHPFSRRENIFLEREYGKEGTKQGGVK